MTCPECGSESAVWDIAKAREELYRKRKCKVCGLKFCTIEYEVEYDEFTFMIGLPDLYVMEDFESVK